MKTQRKSSGINDWRGNILAIVKSKFFYFALFFVVLNLFLTKEMSKGYSNSYTIVFVLGELAVEIIVLGVIFYMRKKDFPLEKLFLAVSIPMGIGFALLLPLGQAPDEPSHIFRAYGISRGDVFVSVDPELGAGSEMPRNLLDNLTWDPESGTIRNLYGNIFEPVSEETIFQRYEGTASYNPICYIPQVIGIIIAKIFSAPMLVSLYMARLFNLAAFIIIIYYAIKIAPKFKNFILFIVITPIAMQQAASFSPDALLISVGIFLISYVMSLIYVKKDKLSTAGFAMLYVLAILIGLLKIVYLPLLLLYFLIPDKVFGSRKSKIIHAVIMMLVVAVVNFCWMSYSSIFLTTIDGADSGAQLSFMLSHPLAFLGVLMRTLQVNLRFYAMSGLGTILGTLQIRVPELYTFFSAGILLLMFAQNKEYLKSTTIQRVVYVLVFAVITLLIFVGLYIQWTPVASPIIDGVQGRYFLPFILLMPMFLYGSKPSEVRPSLIKKEHILMYGAFMNICALVCVVVTNF